MSKIQVVKRLLKSQTVRELIGERTFDLFSELTKNPEEDEDGNPISWLIGAGARLVGFVLGGLARSGALLLLRAAKFILLELPLRLVVFNWNASDSQINAWMKGNTESIAAALGRLIGGGGVWLVTIGLATGAALKFPVLGGKVALALAEEGGEEIRAYLQNFVQQAGTALRDNAVLFTYLQSRRAFRKAAGLPPSVADNAEPWTIADATGDVIEKIPFIGDLLRTLLESALEEAGEALLEAGYVISYALDDYYQSARLANQATFGEQRTVKVVPDKRLDQEFITLTGPQTLIQQNVQTALTTHRWIHNRDVGHIVGQPAEDWVRAGMQRRKLTIVFKSKAEPPWSGGTERVKEVSYTIPEPDVGLTWQRIKTAANPFNWGKYRATANLDNGRQMAIYGATPAEAEDKLKELLPLSTGKLLTLSVSEEKDRHVNLKKEVTRMYPAYATLLIRRSTAEMTGTNDLSGNNYKEDHIRLELWPDTEPEGIPPLL